jgi:hypothetical protein
MLAHEPENHLENGTMYQPRQKQLSSALSRKRTNVAQHSEPVQFDTNLAAMLELDLLVIGKQEIDYTNKHPTA